MTKEQRILILEARLRRVKAKGKSYEAPGVVNKIERQLRNLKR